MLITLMTVVAISCGDDVEDPVIYTVTVMTAEGGTADASCYEVIAGEEVTLVATPESGYRFKCWMLNGKEVSTENPYTVVVGKNTVYVAKFVKEGTEDEEEGDENEGENNEDAPSKIETFDVLSEIEKDEMIFVKGGSFKMGATSEQTEDAKADETPVHLVILSDYYISRYEVTQKFWETIMGNNPSSTKGDDLPVDNVSWEECQQFIKKLNATTGKRYSLPTEAEWEYAARGGDKTENNKFSGSNTASEVAWSDAIDGTIETVGTKKYNELGIYDMSGNVSELCYNYYESYTTDDQVNPIGKTTGDKRVVRGGNISSASLNCRVSTRTTIAQTEKQAKTGFRLVLSKPTYEVSVKPSSEELGSVTIAGTTNTQYIREGGEVTLTATPNEGYSFVNWTVNGEEVSKEATCTIKVTKDAEYIANFVTHKVTVVSGEGGTAKTSKTQVGHNGQVTLTATPNEYYSFVNWTVNGKEVSTDNPYTATITADTEFKANFKKTKGEENGYVWVDLGLPSGLKWATCNVGANSPEWYGYYFAWGETEPKYNYDWNTYKYCNYNGSYYTMTKYCTNSSYGTVDNKTTLELIDDAAHVNWGGNWRMPTKAEYDELMSSSNCTWTWTTQNGVKGYKVASKINGNSIFLPAAGYHRYGGLIDAGSHGFYWSSSLSSSYSSNAYDLGFTLDFIAWYGNYRDYGQSVRAVCE